MATNSGVAEISLAGAAESRMLDDFILELAEAESRMLDERSQILRGPEMNRNLPLLVMLLARSLTGRLVPYKAF